MTESKAEKLRWSNWAFLKWELRWGQETHLDVNLTFLQVQCTCISSLVEH